MQSFFNQAVPSLNARWPNWLVKLTPTRAGLVPSVLAILVTAIITFAGTSHYISRNSWKHFVQASSSMEAFNEIHRIDSWEEMEQLLVKGCTKEALQYARVQQSLGLSSLKYHLNQGAKLAAQVEELNRATLSRARSFSSKGRYDIPICK